MLIAIFMAFTRLAIPTIVTLISVVFYASLLIAIICVGISLLCSSVGARVNFGFVGAITTAIANGIGYLGRTAISAIGWVLRHLIRLIPVFYASAKGFFASFGMSTTAATLLAFWATVLLVVVII